jgi:hypothetical protein
MFFSGIDYPQNYVKVQDFRLNVSQNFKTVLKGGWSWGSSVSQSDYRLDDRGSIPGKGKGFSSGLCVETSSEFHPASCSMGTGVPFPGVERSRGMTLTTRSHLQLRSRISRSYTSSPPCRLHGCRGTALFLATRMYKCAYFILPLTLFSFSCEINLHFRAILLTSLL